MGCMIAYPPKREIKEVDTTYVGEWLNNRSRNGFEYFSRLELEESGAVIYKKWNNENNSRLFSVTVGRGEWWACDEEVHLSFIISDLPQQSTSSASIDNYPVYSHKYAIEKQFPYDRFILDPSRRVVAGFANEYFIPTSQSLATQNTGPGASLVTSNVRQNRYQQQDMGLGPSFMPESKLMYANR